MKSANELRTPGMCWMTLGILHHFRRPPNQSTLAWFVLVRDVVRAGIEDRCQRLIVHEDVELGTVSGSAADPTSGEDDASDADSVANGEQMSI